MTLSMQNSLGSDLRIERDIRKCFAQCDDLGMIGSESS